VIQLNFDVCDIRQRCRRKDQTDDGSSSNDGSLFQEEIIRGLGLRLVDAGTPR